MAKQWTFGKKVGAGFAVGVALTTLVGAISIFSLRSVVAVKDNLIAVNAEILVEAERLSGENARKSGAVLRFLLTGDQQALLQLKDFREEVQGILDRLGNLGKTPEEKQLLETIQKRNTELRDAVDGLITLRQTTTPLAVIAQKYDDEVIPLRESLRDAINALSKMETEALRETRESSTDAANAAISFVVIAVGFSVALAILIALTLTRALTRQIGSSVGQIRSSSAELQSAANQQASGAKEQVSAMSEIGTTIGELLATSRQIAESAQRVSQIAEQTAGSARSGDGTVNGALDLIAGIRRQMDLIVSHMLELGKKSQQIGAVLEIVSEMAEQTNILAINATIEAAGAGESGKRFSVVADEIRKLADRVAESTKEIRGLIDDVRSAVNTTVMSTETGSKAVDAGAKQFSEVAASFRQIGGLVLTTTEAAREIELSTKQQTTAVEQVNVAISNVAQATKESEISTGQTLQTASELTTLSRELLLLVEEQA